MKKSNAKDGAVKNTDLVKTEPRATYTTTCDRTHDEIINNIIVFV